MLSKSSELGRYHSLFPVTHRLLEREFKEPWALASHTAGLPLNLPSTCWVTLVG